MSEEVIPGRRAIKAARLAKKIAIDGYMVRTRKQEEDAVQQMAVAIEEQTHATESLETLRMVRSGIQEPALRELVDRHLAKFADDDVATLANFNQHCGEDS